MERSFRIVTNIIVLAALLIPCFGCNVAKSVIAITNKKVKPKTVHFQDKELVFVPISHFGQREFYGSLRDSVLFWKEEEFTVYYEQVTTEPWKTLSDSIELDTVLRKYRRISRGKTFTREAYEDLSRVFKNGIAQPDYSYFGIDSSDVNADITLQDFVMEYENIFGTLDLNQCEFERPLSNPMPCEKAKGNMKKIVLDYRNLYVVERIYKSPHDKIVILYGALHIKPIMKTLKKKYKENLN